MRLIDADALLAEIIKNNSYQVGDYAITFDYGAAAAINNAPTIDAEPVQRGRWEQGKWATYPDDFVCNKCNTGYAIPYNYCPNCGATMDRKEETP